MNRIYSETDAAKVVKSTCSFLFKRLFVSRLSTQGERFHNYFLWGWRKAAYRFQLLKFLVWLTLIIGLKFEFTISMTDKWNQIFYYTRCFTPKRVTSWRGPYPRHCTDGQHSSFRRNAVAVASRWQHCVRFDRPEIWTSDLSLQRQTRYRLTNLTCAGIIWEKWAKVFGSVRNMFLFL